MTQGSAPKKSKKDHLIRICYGPSCIQHSPKYILERAEAESEDKPNITVESCGCLGACDNAPNASIDKTIHTTINGPKISHIIQNLPRA